MCRINGSSLSQSPRRRKSSSSLSEQFLQDSRFYGFYQVQLAAGLSRSFAILILRKGRQNNHAAGAKLWVSLHLATDFESVDAGKPQVQQHKVGTKTPCNIQRDVSVDGVFDDVTHVGQQECKGMHGVEMVFDHQNALRRFGRLYSAFYSEGVWSARWILPPAIAGADEMSVHCP